MAPVNLIKAGGPISMAGSLRSQTPRITSLSAQNFGMFPKGREALSEHLSDEKREEEKSEEEDTILLCEPTVRETNYTAVSGHRRMCQLLVRCMRRPWEQWRGNARGRAHLLSAQ